VVLKTYNAMFDMPWSCGVYSLIVTTVADVNFFLSIIKRIFRVTFLTYNLTIYFSASSFILRSLFYIKKAWLGRLTSREFYWFSCKLVAITMTFQHRIVGRVFSLFFSMPLFYKRLAFDHTKRTIEIYFF